MKGLMAKLAAMEACLKKAKEEKAKFWELGIENRFLREGIWRSLFYSKKFKLFHPLFRNIAFLESDIEWCRYEIDKLKKKEEGKEDEEDEFEELKKKVNNP